MAKKITKKPAKKKAAKKKAPVKRANKTVKAPNATKYPAPVQSTEAYEPSDLVIKEIMHQKGVTREQAIHILKNPTQ